VSPCVTCGNAKCFAGASARCGCALHCMLYAACCALHVGGAAENACLDRCDPREGLAELIELQSNAKHGGCTHVRTGREGQSTAVWKRLWFRSASERGNVQLAEPVGLCLWLALRAAKRSSAREQRMHMWHVSHMRHISQM
jgi:hypothetical protein